MAQNKPIFQKTLKHSVNCTGVALHSGQENTLTLHPTSCDSGIRFVRTDLPSKPEIPARWDQVTDTTLCTVLGNAQNVRVRTIEHLMAAFAGCGIDNAIVEINGDEVPIMDGSSEPFVLLIESAGIAQQTAPKKALKILQPITVTAPDKKITLSPSTHSTFHFEVDFNHAVINRQSCGVSLVNGTFKDEISRARTFGFLNEVDHLRRLGLVKGGSLDNAIVISRDAILNKGGLRYDDEIVRHKILDSIGDLYLAGHPIIGAFHGYRSGHTLNNQLLHALFEKEEAWELVDYPAEADTH